MKPITLDEAGIDTVDEVKDVRDVAVAMRAYARQAKNKELEADAWEIRVRAERRVGELIAAQRETIGLSQGGRPSRIQLCEHGGAYGGESCQYCRRKQTGAGADPVPTLAEAGIDKHLADRARKLTKPDAESFEQRLQEGRSRILDVSERVRVDVLATTAHVGQNSGENEWYTPRSPDIEIARATRVFVPKDLTSVS